MLIDTYTAANGATIELRTGISGSGNTLYCLQFFRNGNCYHADKFTSLPEAKSWLKHACGVSGV